MTYLKVTQLDVETECQTNEQMENKNFVKRQAQRQISFNENANHVPYTSDFFLATDFSSHHSVLSFKKKIRERLKNIVNAVRFQIRASRKQFGYIE